MKWLLGVFPAVHALIALLFVFAALLLMVIGVSTAWSAMSDGFTHKASLGVIEAVGLLAVAVVALQIGQTILEEEVVRSVHVSAPTRVRRFLSRFLVVVVVALSIEGLVAVFQALHQDPERLPEAASVLVAVGAMLAGWGVFIKLNRAAEELEPEAMAEAKREDAKLN